MLEAALAPSLPKGKSDLGSSPPHEANSVYVGILPVREKKVYAISENCSAGDQQIGPVLGFVDIAGNIVGWEEVRFSQELAESTQDERGKFLLGRLKAMRDTSTREGWLRDLRLDMYHLTSLGSW